MSTHEFALKINKFGTGILPAAPDLFSCLLVIVLDGWGLHKNRMIKVAMTIVIGLSVFRDELLEDATKV